MTHEDEDDDCGVGGLPINAMRVAQYLIDEHDIDPDEAVKLVAAHSDIVDPETSSSTATSTEAKGRTRVKGHWFDGYYEE